jgi:hypothetical protein
MKQSKISKESISFRTEGPGVGAVGLSREFGEDLVVRGNDGAVGAFVVRCDTVRAKQERRIGSEGMQEGIKIR